MQKFLPPADLTILLDIAPETAAQRKAADRDRYERDLALLGRVRQSYARQAAAGGWLVLDGERTRDEVAADVYERSHAGSRVVAYPLRGRSPPNAACIRASARTFRTKSSDPSSHAGFTGTPAATSSVTTS